MLSKYPLITTIWQPNKGKLIAVGVLLFLMSSMLVVQQWVTEPNLDALLIEQTRLQQNVRQRQLEATNRGVPVSVAEQMATNLQKFDDLIPLQSDFSDFIGELYDYAQQTQLAIHQISYNSEYEKDSANKLLRYGLNFSVNGDYAQVKKFIHLLENAPRILLIDKISMSGSGTKKGALNKVDLQIELATYFQGRAV